MPIQPPQWTEFLSCPVCYKKFNDSVELPISLGCGHTVCKVCLSKLHQKKCPFDQTLISRSIEELPVNLALLQLAGATIPEQDIISISSISENFKYYDSARRCIGDLAAHLKCLATGIGQLNSLLSRPMQRKLVTLINCQLVEEEGRSRAMRSARSLGERSVTELILQHQNPTQLSTNLWAAIRARGCQFLGPAMQEEVLKLILLALEDGSPLSRKVLVLFVVQRLESQYPQASKTAIGHVVQLLYRASCFKVTKREEESSLMQLKEDFRTYELLRREHDSQVVQIATEAGLRIAPEQWSSLLYGDAAHKSHMQSIIDKLQTPQSFAQSVNELVIALQRTGDLGNLARLCPHLELLANVDPSPDAPPPTWENLEAVLKAVRTVVQGLVDFLHFHSQKKPELPALHSTKYKTSLCRDFAQKSSCPRGANCTFAHSQEELERARGRNKKSGVKPGLLIPPALPSQMSVQDGGELREATRSPNIMRSVRGFGATRNESQDLTVDGEIDSGPAEPILTHSVASTDSPLPPMIAPPSVMSSRVGPPMYTGGMPYRNPTGPPRDEYVPANLQTQTVPSVSRYNHHPYMAEGVYYPQHGVSTFPASFTTDVPGQYPGGVGYHTPPSSHNLHNATHYMGVYESRYPSQNPYENWPPSMPYYMGPETQYPHSLPPRYAHTPHMVYPEQNLFILEDNLRGSSLAEASGTPARHNDPGASVAEGVSTPAWHNDPAASVAEPPWPRGFARQHSAMTQEPLTSVVAPGRESLDDLHHRRKKILVHLNRAPTPLPPTPSEPPCGVGPPPTPSTAPQGINPPGVYRLKSVPMSDSGIMLPSLERRPPSSHELAKSVTDTYNASRSLSTLSLSSQGSCPREGMVYTPWSTGESYTPTSDILVDTSTRGSAAYTEKYPEMETEEEFNLYKELSDQMRDVNVESPSPVMSTALSSSPSATSTERSIHGCAKSSASSLDDAYFIPFDPPIVSKYGPISRTSKAKLKSSDPVLVTAKSDSYMVTAVTAVTPTTRPYPVSVQTPSRFAVESVPSQLCPNAEPFTSRVAMPQMPRPQGETNNKSQPYTLWESRDMMYPPPSVGNPTVQDRLKHELAMVEHQIHIRENSTRKLSDKERLQCELQAIEKHISLQTGKPPNASLETSTNHTRRPASSSTRVWPANKKIFTKSGPVLDPDIDLNAALTPEEEQELNDLHLLVQTSKKDNGCAENQTGTFTSKETQEH